MNKANNWLIAIAVISILSHIVIAVCNPPNEIESRLSDCEETFKRKCYVSYMIAPENKANNGKIIF